jgi:photosystem II stability/assembly factor-like uncharacterized protein
VPSGAPSTVTVSGPSGFSQTLSATTTLENLAAGTYVITAPIVNGASGANLLYVPALTGSPATVTANATAVTSASYTSLSTLWRPVGPGAIKIFNGIPAAGKLDALAIDNSSPLVTVPGTQIQIHSVMYVGGGIYDGPATEPGIYKTTNGGQTWTQASNGLTDPAVGSLWLDQANHNALVAATWTKGLFQSTDGGQSWMLTGPYGSSTALLQAGSALYAGTSQGIYSSPDSGKTWTSIQASSSPVRSLSSAGAVIYAGLDDGQVLVQSSPNGAWQTTTPAVNLSAESITTNPANPLDAFVVDMGYYNIPDFFQTTDGGTDWSPVIPANAGGGQVSVQVTAFDGSNGSLYAGADVYFGSSTDGGKTFTQMSPPDADSPGAWYDERLIVPQAGGIAGQTMVTADQGLYLTADGGNTWHSLNGNLTSSIVYVAAVNGKTLICTMQDLGPVSSFDGAQTWDSHQSNNPAGSEGGTALINPGAPQYAYVYTGYGFQVSTDGGYNYTYSSTLTANGFPGGAGNSQLIAVDLQNPAIVYAAAQNGTGVQEGIYKSQDYGQSWALQSWPIAQPVMVAIDPTNDKNIFVGQGDGNLKVTHDGGKTWIANPIGIVTGNIWWPVTLAVNPATPNAVLVGMSGPPAAGGGVFRSTDGGNSFVQANSGLDPGNAQPWPDQIFRMSYDPAGSGLVAAARFSGIYLSSDNGANWVSAQGNIVPYTLTSVMWDSGYLYASTFGEGVVRLGGPF